MTVCSGSYGINIVNSIFQELLLCPYRFAEERPPKELR
jgi:hypothetical protein